MRPIYPVSMRRGTRMTTQFVTLRRYPPRKTCSPVTLILVRQSLDAVLVGASQQTSAALHLSTANQSSPYLIKASFI
jgi:hypothetical protein